MKLKKLLTIWLMVLGLMVGVGSSVRASGLEDESPGKWLCEWNLEGDNKQRCLDCTSGGDRVWTAIGCLPTNTMELVSSLIGFLMGLAGLFFVIQIVISGAQIIFANGDSSAIATAKKRLTNSIIAILFIIFSVTILQIIGVQILRLPGFFGN